MRPLRPPSDAERALARAAAAALRAALADPSTMGERWAAHLDFNRPRRGEWWETWRNLPGFVRVDGWCYRHDCLPGWQYAAYEVRHELIPDLEALAERGAWPNDRTATFDRSVRVSELTGRCGPR